MPWDLLLAGVALLALLAAVLWRIDTLELRGERRGDGPWGAGSVDRP